MLGGLVPVPESWPVEAESHVLYSWWLIPHYLKYDISHSDRINFTSNISDSFPVGNFLSNIFKGPSDEMLLNRESIHKMNLLVASAAPTSGDSSQHIPTVEHNALVSEIGPAGLVSDATAHKATSDQISVYVVREGDTLSQIAEMFNVTVNTIKWGNDLSSNTLKAGEVLVILPISGVKHTVKKGDTADSLAKKYKGDVEEILAYNNLNKGDSLIVGSVVIIPDGEVLPAPSSTSGSGTRSPGHSSGGLKEYAGYYMRPVAQVVDPVEVRTVEAFGDDLDVAVVHHRMHHFLQAHQWRVTPSRVEGPLYNFFIHIEDKYFYEHGGVRIPSIIRAEFNNLIGRKAGSGGASTLTQQLIKNTDIQLAQSHLVEFAFAVVNAQ
jgi:LysM repeat protein